MTTGVLSDTEISALLARGEITVTQPVAEGQIQPASLDLRLGQVAYRVRASFLAGKGRRVESRLEEFEMHRMDLSKGAVLEKGAVYLVPLMEGLALPAGITAVANAKSSTGRLDLLTRVITDEAPNSTGSARVTQARSMPRSARAASRCWSAPPACASTRFASVKAKPC